MADAEKAFDEGRQAAIDGKDAGANPYPQGSEEFSQWRKGYEFVETYDEDGEVPSDPG